MTRSVEVTDTEFPGAMKVRFVDVDISNYDSDGSGDGESLAPSDVGMHRFQTVNAEVKFGEGSATTVVNCEAQYDYQNDAIRLLYGGTDGGTLSEVASNANEGAMVRLECKGR